MPSAPPVPTVQTRPVTLDGALAGWAAGDRVAQSVAATITAVCQAAVEVADLVRRAPLDRAATDAQTGRRTNASGDEQKPLDLRAEAAFLAALRRCDVAVACSEETEEAIPLRPRGSLAVALDPIDGSSNLDIDGPTGTLFSILPADGFADPAAAILQTGRRQLAAGAVVYGPSVVLALTVGDGTDLYALNPDTGAFERTHARVALPSDAREYAINASNARHWDAGIQAYVGDLVSGSHGPRNQDFNMRWLASLVAETYRILLRGGIFLYPADHRPAYRSGRIRLVYEANPVALLCEQAGGLATDGVLAILDRVPAGLHERTPFVFGSSNKVTRVARYVQEPPTTHQESALFSTRGLFRL